MQKSTLYLLGTALGSLLLVLMIWIHPLVSHESTAHRLLTERRVVSRYHLTDICLFTEAPHTRHPNLADRFVPFQNHPSAAPHFPSESFLSPPHHLTHARSATAEGATP